MIQSNLEMLLTIFIIMLGILFTRFITFIVFPPNDNPHPFILYLGQVLPRAAIALILVYALKDIKITHSPYGIPELISLIFLFLIHFKYRNTLLSIALSTGLYMLIVQWIL